jgi:RNA polymerase sigma factor (sigma-70 family)
VANADLGTLTSDLGAVFDAELSRKISDRQLLERYLAQHDDAAFVNLFRRYARSVWGVCRRVLRQDQDAEDAFQAVFFILARKAASIRKAEAVGSWLYGVAYRTALKARQMRSDRTTHEKKARVPKQIETPASETAWRDLQKQLDDELQKLPEKYRAPFVLCCLEGMSRADAARELLWKEGTVSSRLAQARKILQTRLARRGVTLSALLTGLALAQNGASAAAPAALVQATVSAVLAPQAATVASSAAVLAETVIKGMAVAKIKVAFAVVTAVLMVVSSMGVAAAYLGTAGKQKPATAATQKDGAKNASDDVEPLAPLPAPLRLAEEEVLALAFSPLDHRLVSAGARKQGHLLIWDVDKASLLASVLGIPGVRSVAFSPDGNAIATGDFSGAIWLRDARTGTERTAAEAHKVGVNAVAFSADGNRLASGGLDRLVRIWDASNLKEQKTFLGHTDMVYSVAYFRDGKSIVSGGKDRSAIIWSVETGKEKFRLHGHLSAVEFVAVSPDDLLVATGSWDQTVKLWDAATGRERTTLRGHNAAVFALAISPDSKKLASSDAAGNVFLWDLGAGKPIGPLAKHGNAVWAVAFSHDGKYLASGGSDGITKVWDLAAGKEARALVMPGKLVSALANTPDKKLPPQKVAHPLPVDAPKPKTSYAQEYYHSFKGNPQKNTDFELSGPEADQCVAFEPAGLRIKLPTDFPHVRGFTGVATHFPIKGDFELTLGFEILTEPDPGSEGEGTGFGVTVDVQGAARDHARFNRVVRFNSRLLTTYLEVTNPADGMKRNPYYSTPSGIRTGWLRIVRGGNVLSFFVAEGGDNFKFVHHETFSPTDVKQVLIAATMGGPEASEDVRILDLRIRADSLPGTSGGPTTARDRGWLVYALVVGVMLTVLLAGSVLLRQRKKAAANRPAKVSVNDASKDPETAVSPIGLTCSGCGKSLRVKPELAGKKVKCPHCSAAVPVPTTG